MVERTSTRSLEQVLLDKGQALFTGRIDVALGPWLGSLHLSEGQLVDARIGPFSGEAALWRMMLPSAPRITAEAGRARATGGSVLGRLDALMPRAAERLALLERLAEKVGGLDRTWAIRFDALQARLESLPDGIHPVLRLLDGRRPVRQVVAECPVDDVLALRVLGKLLSEGILILPDTALPMPSDEVIDVEGGLEEALTAALAELSADDHELPVVDGGAGLGMDAAHAGPAPQVPPLSQPGPGTSSKPPGPMPAPTLLTTSGGGGSAPAADERAQPERAGFAQRINDAGALAQHLVLPRPAPPVATSDELRSWLGAEEAFFSLPPSTAFDAGQPSRKAQLPWAALATLAVVAVLVGVVLGRGCG